MVIVRQYINLVHSDTKTKIPVCCGTMSYKLNLSKSYVCNKQRPLTGGEFYVKNTLVESYKEGIIF